MKAAIDEIDDPDNDVGETHVGDEEDDSGRPKDPVDLQVNRASSVVLMYLHLTSSSSTEDTHRQTEQARHRDSLTGQAGRTTTMGGSQHIEGETNTVGERAESTLGLTSKKGKSRAEYGGPEYGGPVRSGRRWAREFRILWAT